MIRRSIIIPDICPVISPWSGTEWETLGCLALVSRTRKRLVQLTGVLTCLILHRLLSAWTVQVLLIHSWGYNGTQYTTMKYTNGIVMTVKQPYLEDNISSGHQVHWYAGLDWKQLVVIGNAQDASRFPAELAGSTSIEQGKRWRKKMEANSWRCSSQQNPEGWNGW